MKRGFIRVSKAGMDTEKQEIALASVGISDFSEYGPVYVGDREMAIASLQNGDQLVVASAACLGHPEQDVLAALKAVSDRGATVFDVETGTTISWHPDADIPLQFAIRAGRDNRVAIAAKAREGKAGPGRPPKTWTRERIGKLNVMLAQNKLTREEMAAALGISRPTLQRRIAKMMGNSRKGASGDG